MKTFEVVFFPFVIASEKDVELNTNGYRRCLLYSSQSEAFFSLRCCLFVCSFVCRSFWKT